MSIVNPYFEREAASEVSMKSQQDNNDQDVIMRNANNDQPNAYAVEDTSVAVDLKQITERSNEYLEFGVQNRSGHMNCFLNTGLQLIWSLWLTSDLESLKAFVQLPIEHGPELLQPLMNAITKFYQQVGLNSSEVPKLSSVGIRREMFKLYYRCESFDLNEKADAFEAFDFLLTCIHSWVR